MILMAALGLDTGALFAARRKTPMANASSMLAAPKDGIVRSIRLPEKLPEDVYDLHLIVEPGDTVRTFRGTIDRIGQIIVSGETVPVCMERIAQVLATVEIEVE